MSPAKPEQPMCLAAGEPSDPGRVKDLARANESMKGEGGGWDRGGVDGVTECLGTCHFVSALACTSGLLSL